MNEIWIGWFAGLAFGLAINSMLDPFFARRRARLNDAAPDLLDACETYHNLLRNQIRDGRPADAEAHYQAQCKMESAIKKARGEK